MTQAMLTLAALIGAAALQMTLPLWPWPTPTRFPCLMAVTLHAATHPRSAMWVWVAWGAGFLQDVLSPLPLGYSMVAFLGIALLIRGVQRAVVTESAVTRMLMGAGSNALAALLLSGLLARRGLLPGGGAETLRRAVSQACAGLLCTPLLMWLLTGVEIGLGCERRRSNVPDVGWDI